MYSSFFDRNRLLAALTTSGRKHLADHMRLVHLRSGQVLYEPSSRRNHAYFPLDCTISLLNVGQDGHSAELATLGQEGFVGIPGIFGGWRLLTRVVAETAGAVAQIDVKRLLDGLESNPVWCQRLSEFVEAMLAQSAQRLFCVCHHSLKLRLCRWLLLRLDWLNSRELHISHTFIAELLGVRRETITLALDELRAAGLLQVRRGYIRLLDRRAMESRACECYRIIRQEYARLDVFPEPANMKATSADRLATVLTQRQTLFTAGNHSLGLQRVTPIASVTPPPAAPPPEYPPLNYQGR